MENDFNDNRTDFYDVFYSKIFKKFVDYISIPLKSLKDDDETRTEFINSKQLTLDLITHCIKLHGQRVRYWIIHNDLLSTILDLLKDESKVIHIFVIKFIKNIILNNVSNIICNVLLTYLQIYRMKF